jgi:hypothetical protein
VGLVSVGEVVCHWVVWSECENKFTGKEELPPEREL